MAEWKSATLNNVITNYSHISITL